MPGSDSTKRCATVSGGCTSGAIASRNPFTEKVWNICSFQYDSRQTILRGAFTRARMNSGTEPELQRCAAFGVRAGSKCASPNSRLAQEVEIAAVLGLEHVIHVQLGVAARRHAHRRAPRGSSLLQLIRVHQQIDRATLYRDADAIAVAHQREPPPGCGLLRDVQHDGAVSGAGPSAIP